MVDIAAITVAIISLITSILAAGLTSWAAYKTEKRKYLRENEKVLRKYRDPLLLAAKDLQARLWSIVDYNALTFIDRTQEHRDALFIRTAFLVGQYFAWTHILRLRAQFMAFSAPEKEHRRVQKFMTIVDKIQHVFTTDRDNEDDIPFMLWKGHQTAIGEIMTIRDDKEEELLCMGFAEFTRRWKAEEATLRSRGHADPCRRDQKKSNDPQNELWLEHPPRVHDESEEWGTDLELHTWFRSVYEGIHALVGARRRQDVRAETRVRRLQHLLLDLIKVLDPKAERSFLRSSKYCKRASECPCFKCDGEPQLPEDADVEMQDQEQKSIK